MKKMIFVFLIFIAVMSISYANDYPSGSMPTLPGGITVPGMGSGNNIAKGWKIPSSKEVCNLIVNVDGWSATQCSGSNIKTMNGIRMVSVEREYKNGDRNIGVTVLSGNMAVMGWAAFSQGISMESDKELVKIIDIGDYKMGVSYNKIDHSGSIIVPLLKTKELQKEQAFAVIGLNFTNMNYKEAIEFVKNFDFELLEALFRK